MTHTGIQQTLGGLSRMLCQPLPDLPLDCPATEEEVSQVRLVVESMEELIGRELPGAPDAAVSPLSHRVTFVVAADVDGDGRDELVLGFDEEWVTQGEPARSGLWVLHYDQAVRRWQHLRPGGDARRAALLLPFGTHAIAGFAGRFRADSLGRDQLAVAVTIDGSAGAAYWVLQFDPGVAPGQDPWIRVGPGPGVGPGADLVLPVGSVTGALAADVDGDGLDEFVAFGTAPPDVGGVGDRLDAFWVYDLVGDAWVSLTAPGDAAGVAFTCFSAPGNPSRARIGRATAGDVDLDGREEIIAVPQDPDSRFIAVLRYGGTPGQWAHVAPSGQPLEADVVQILPGPTAHALVGSVSASNRPDLVTASAAEPTRFIEWRYTPPAQFDQNPYFADGPAADVSPEQLPADLAVLADVDGDGRDELVVLTHRRLGLDRRDAGWVMHRDDNSVWTHLSPIPGHPLGADIEWTPDGRWPAWSVVAADVDGDDRDELVLSIGEANTIWVLDYDPDAGRWQHLSPVVPAGIGSRYAFAAYRALLLEAGASFDDLRLAAGADAAERAALAERLGVSLAGGRPDVLDRMLLDPATVDMAALETLFGLASTRRDRLSQGLVEGTGAGQVRRWRVNGARWSADPACANTDPDGVLHLRASRTTPGQAEVRACRDPAWTEDVALGEGPTDGPVVLREVLDSGLTGSVLLGLPEAVADADVQVRIFPTLVVDRWRRLREQWDAADVPDDPFRPGAASGGEIRRPIVDPAVIGPDDFRLPVPTPGQAAPDGVFDLWIRRRAWLDGVLAGLRQIGPDTGDLLTSMRTSNPQHLATPWAGATADLDALADSILTGPATERAAATATVRDELHLPVDAFLRLLALRDTAPPLTAADQAEFRWILALAHRRSSFPAWLAEEAAASVRLDAATFVVTPRPVTEGAWPPEPGTPLPLVDPERVAADDLPRSVAGDEARVLWARRAEELAGNADTVTGARPDGWEKQLRVALGSVVPGGALTWSAWVLARSGELDDQDPDTVAAAVTAISATFGDVGVAAFRRLAEVTAVFGDGLTPTGPGWADAERTLATARKSAVLYPVWLAQENPPGRPMPFWKVLRLAQTRWLSPVEDRQAWLIGLEVRCRPPAVDPDLVPVESIRTGNAPGPGCAAERRHAERVGELTAHQDALRAVLADHTGSGWLQRVDATLLAGLWTDAERAAVRADLAARRAATSAPTVVKEVFGPDAGRIATLQADLDATGPAAAAAREVISGELGFSTESAFRELAELMAAPDQASPAQLAVLDATLAAAWLLGPVTRAERLADLLGLRVRDVIAPVRLDLAAWRRLLAVRDLAAAGSPLLDTEIDDLIDILLRCVKERRFGAWQAGEQDTAAADRVRLGPDSFVLPDETWTPTSPRSWRVRDTERRSWRATVRARTDQHDAVLAAVLDAVARTEQATLPGYRDELLAALPVPATQPGLGAGARWVTDHLLVDTAESGIRRTTRVAHAIDTLLTLLWSVRTGQAHDAYPDLALEAPTFDEDWRWIGSYATWRSAMLVHLYPENLLRPTLRRYQSPALTEALTDLRSSRQLTPVQARRIAGRYAEYLSDVARLDQGQIICAQVRTAWTPLLLVSPPGRTTNCRLFVTVSESSRRVYWALEDISAAAAATGYALSFWHRLDAFATGDVTTLVGAAQYAPDHWVGGKQWRFVFAQTRDVEGERLSFARYDLTAATWDSEATTLEAPPGATEFRAWLFATPAGTPPRVGFEYEVIQGDRREVVRRARSLNAKGTNWAREDFVTLGAYGTWQPVDGGADYAAAAITARALLSGDIDGDGRDELVVVPTTDAAPVVLRYDGAAWTRLPAPPITIPPDARVVVGRFTATAAGDLRDDIAWVREGAHTTVLSFSGGWTITGDTTGWVPQLGATHVVAGDFDGDGRAEIAVAGRINFPFPFDVPGTSAFWILGNTDQGMQPKQSLIGTDPTAPDHRSSIDIGLRAAFRCAPYTASWAEGPEISRPRPGFVLAGDFDGDGRDELAAALDPVNGQISQGNDLWVMDVLPGSGRWAPLGPAAVNPQYPLHTVLDLSGDELRLLGGVTGDFDGDDRDEIAIFPLVERAGTGTSIIIADFRPGNDPANPAQNGQWGTLPNLDLSAATRPAETAVSGDFDGDGADEIVVLGNDMLWLRKFDVAANEWIELPSDLLRPGDPTGFAFGRAGNFTGATGTALTPRRGARLDRVPDQVALHPGTLVETTPAAGTPFQQRSVVGAGTSPTVLGRQLTAIALRAAGCTPPAWSVPRWLGGWPWSLDDTLPARQRASRSRALIGANLTAPATVRRYLEEAFYDLPVAVALALQDSHDYDHALDWYRIVFDYAAAAADRKSYYGLVLDEHGTAGDAPADPTGYARDLLTWVRDPLNPHAVAAIRPHSYTRGTLQLLIRCLLDYADAEFTRDTPESVERARVLYRSAVDLLDEPVLRQRLGRCDDVIVRIPATVQPTLAAAPPPILRDALPSPSDPRVPALGTLVGPSVAAVMTRVTASLEPTLLPHAPSIAGPTFCVSPNPVLTGLRLHAELNLFKLRTGRNIAGLRRTLDLYAAPTDQTSGLPMIGADGELVLPGLRAPAPTPYRYTALVEQARVLASQAREAESTMLAALEKRDAEALSLLRARQEVRVARASVQVQELRVRQAEDRVTAAQAQQDRAAFQEDYFGDLLSAGPLAFEREALSLLGTAAGLQLAAAVAYAAAAGLSAASAIANWDPSKTYEKLAALASSTGAALSAGAANASTWSQWNSLQAGYARTQQSWQLQQQLARFDRTIAGAQVTVETDGVRIAEQERAIGEIQADNAEQLLEFQAAKFTNVNLYDWLSDVLERTYRWYLQQGTSMAQLAAAQLAFERQEDQPPAIQADYWEPPAQGFDALTEGTGPDRRGLTGAERLLQDIAELEQYAFTTARRRQQLTRTISLAQLDPLGLARLRTDGVVTFATPMRLFDEDFPGHHLRLIRRVSLSVVALTPAEGIRATLSSSGTSRIVVGPDVFQTVILRREPETLSLMETMNARGVFDFEPHTGLRDAFEGQGVDTTWELRMPKPANPFDFSTIADVLLTIDYTAIDSADLRARVVRELDRTQEGERGFSLRQDFPDAWWDLTNPDAADTPLNVSLGTRALDFPVNLAELEITQIALALITESDPPAPLSTLTLHFRADGGTAVLGGTAAPVDKVVSTRRSNGGPWLPITGKAPAGTWRLQLPDSEDTREWIAQGGLTDILLVISYRARTAAWPG
ncbi:neuraminidase-like domain-containing protein [Phytohabitans houttuyneae]